MEKFFYCPICSKEYVTQKGLDTHLGKSHKEYYELEKRKKLEESQKNNIVQCPYCEQKFSSVKSLINHTTRTHKINSQQTIVEYKYNGIHPLCKCGCNNTTKYNSGKADFNEYLKGHIARVNNNFQTEKSISNSRKTKRERAELGIYKGILKSEEHKDKIRQKSLLQRHTDESKEKMSELKKQWIKNNPEKATYYNVQFWKDYWKDPQHRFEQGERRVEYLKTQQMVFSKLEIEFEEILKLFNIEYEKQFRVKRKLYDFKIKDKNILIEVDGDFWHCSPDMFPDGPICQVQKKNLENDIIKNKLALESGYKLVRIWEHEIRYQKGEVIDKLKNLLL